MENIQIPYGIKDGELFHISQVESGLACGCVCPACSEKLVARKGDKKEHYFAHYSGNSCPGALETALHLAAKDILEDKKRITLPAVGVQCKYGRRPREIEIVKSKNYKIDSIRSEIKLGDIVPDLILEIMQRKLLVEVFVTHKVDREKLYKIMKLGISAIEIDLSSAPRDMPMEILSELIVNGTDNKKWLYSERANSEFKKLKGKSIRKKLNCDGSVEKVGKCPPKEVNKHIIDFNVDYCRRWCKHCLDIEPKTGIPEYVYCIGHIQDIGKEHK